MWGNLSLTCELCDDDDDDRTLLMSLQLDKLGVTGHIPDDLALWLSLQMLSMTTNPALAGTIPYSLAALTN
jgi:hypothetical protein